MSHFDDRKVNLRRGEDAPPERGEEGVNYFDVDSMLRRGGLARGGYDNQGSREVEFPNYLQRIKDVFLLAINDPTCNIGGPGLVSVIHLMPSHRIVTRGAIYFRAATGQPVNIVGLGATVDVLRRESPDRGGSPVTGVIYSGGFPANTSSIDDANNFSRQAPGPVAGDPRPSVEGFAFSAHSQGEDQILVNFVLPPVSVLGVGIAGEWRYKWSYEPGPGLSMVSGEWDLLSRSCRVWPILPGNRPIRICAGIPT